MSTLGTLTSFSWVAESISRTSMHAEKSALAAKLSSAVVSRNVNGSCERPMTRTGLKVAGLSYADSGQGRMEKGFVKLPRPQMASRLRFEGSCGFVSSRVVAAPSR